MDTQKRKIAVYPGTFDPLTNGHVSLIRRAREIFDVVIVGVAFHTPKKTLFSVDERVDMAREALAADSGIQVEAFSGLLVDYAESRNACAILRGLRAVSDFDYEFQMALMNRRLQRNLQTVFLMTDFQWMYISSTIIRGTASVGGDVSGLVPDNVLQRLKAAFASGKSEYPQR